MLKKLVKIMKRNQFQNDEQNQSMSKFLDDCLLNAVSHNVHFTALHLHVSVPTGCSLFLLSARVPFLKMGKMNLRSTVTELSSVFFFFLF